MYENSLDVWTKFKVVGRVTEEKDRVLGWPLGSNVIDSTEESEEIRPCQGVRKEQKSFRTTKTFHDQVINILPDAKPNRV